MAMTTQDATDDAFSALSKPLAQIIEEERKERALQRRSTKAIPQGKKPAFEGLEKYVVPSPKQRKSVQVISKSGGGMVPSNISSSTLVKDKDIKRVVVVNSKSNTPVVKVTIPSSNSITRRVMKRSNINGIDSGSHHKDPSQIKVLVATTTDSSSPGSKRAPVQVNTRMSHQIKHVLRTRAMQEGTTSVGSGRGGTGQTQSNRVVTNGNSSQQPLTLSQRFGQSKKFTNISRNR